MFFRPIIAFIAMMVSLVSADAVSYPRPSIYDKSAHFSLKVNGTYMYTVSYAGFDYVHLSMDEGCPTEFRIKAMDEKLIESYYISPRNLSINATSQGNELLFSLTEAQYLIIKINDGKEFVVMVDPAETDVPDPSADGVYNVMDYDADDSGKSITKGIQNAIDAAAKKTR